MKKVDNDFDIFENPNNNYSNEFYAFLNQQILTYIGNKRNLLTFLFFNGVKNVQEKLGKNKFSILDGFSGSGITSRFLKSFSENLYVNDIELYAKVLSNCYLMNRSEVNESDLQKDIAYLNSHKLRNDLGEGIIKKLYAPKDINNIKKGERVFYTPNNAIIIDNIRRMIPECKSNFYLLLAPLICQASICVNTSGIFKGFYKNKDGIGQFGGEDKNCIDRIKKDIELKMPVFSRYECELNIYQEDINKLILDLPEIDLAYYDPPYNQHPYGSNYFMLNIISEYKEPQKISKVSGIPLTWNKSSYNTKEAKYSFEELIKNTRAKFILISYNDEGLIPIEDMEKILSRFGKLQVSCNAYNAFRASRNLSLRKKYVKEYLFLLQK